MNNCRRGTAVLPSAPAVPAKAEGTAAGGRAGHLVPLLLPTQGRSSGWGLVEASSIQRPGDQGGTGTAEGRTVPQVPPSSRVCSSPQPRRSHHRCREFAASLKGGSAHEMFSRKWKMLGQAPVSEEIQGRQQSPSY